MDQPDPPPGSAGSGAVRPAAPAAPGGARRALLPAGTFLLGALLGAGVVAAGADEEPDRPTAAPPSASPAPTPGSPDLLVRVPDSCLQAADRTSEAYALLDRGVAAARDLDAGALADLVDEVQRRRPEVQALVDGCRAAAGDAVVPPTPAG